jgi:hypothetical protein
VKRAILPAAISDTAVIRWLAEAGRREQPFPRGAAGRKTERDDHHEQNSAYSPPTLLTHGAFSSIGRALVCGTGGCGFEPRKAPHQLKQRAGQLAGPLFFSLCSLVRMRPRVHDQDANWGTTEARIRISPRRRSCTVAPLPADSTGYGITLLPQRFRHASPALPRPSSGAACTNTPAPANPRHRPRQS